MMNEPVANSPEQHSAASPALPAEDCQPTRRPLYSLVRITYCSESAGGSVIGRGIDVSDGGIAFEIRTPLDVDRLILLEYTDTSDDCRYRRRTATLRYLNNRTFLANFVDPGGGELLH
jgi:hypothetical protein